MSPDSLRSDRGGMCLPLELPIHPKKTDDNLCGKGGMGSAFKFTFESTPKGEKNLLYSPRHYHLCFSSSIPKVLFLSGIISPCRLRTPLLPSSSASRHTLAVPVSALSAISKNLPSQAQMGQVFRRLSWQEDNVPLSAPHVAWDLGSGDCPALHILWASLLTLFEITSPEFFVIVWISLYICEDTLLLLRSFALALCLNGYT